MERGGGEWDTFWFIPISPIFLGSHKFPYRNVNKKVSIQISGGKMGGK